MKFDQDTIVQVDVGADVDNFIHVLSMFGSSHLQSEDMERYFIAKALMAVSALTPTDALVNSVHDKIHDSLRQEFNKDDSIQQKTKIMQEWLVLVDTLKASLNQYLYEDGGRNHLVVTYRDYLGNGVLQLILHDGRDDVSEER